MFGLTFEKLFLVALLAAVIIGPRRLPSYAGKAAALVRRATAFAVDARRRAEEETGVAVMREDWRALDPRQYDPRRIIREAWADAEAGAASRGSSSDADMSASDGAPVEKTTIAMTAEAPRGNGAPDAVAEASSAMSDALGTVASTHSPDDGSAMAGGVVTTEGDHVSEHGEVDGSERRHGRWIVSGTSAHPRRVWVPIEG